MHAGDYDARQPQPSGTQCNTYSSPAAAAHLGVLQSSGASRSHGPHKRRHEGGDEGARHAQAGGHPVSECGHQAARDRAQGGWQAGGRQRRPGSHQQAGKAAAGLHRAVHNRRAARPGCQGGRRARGACWLPAAAAGAGGAGRARGRRGGRVQRHFGEADGCGDEARDGARGGRGGWQGAERAGEGGADAATAAGRGVVLNVRLHVVDVRCTWGRVGLMLV